MPPAALAEPLSKVPEAAKPTRLGYFPLSSFQRIQDPLGLSADYLMVEAIATSEAVDSFGTIVDYAAMKRCAQSYKGRLWEMHLPWAAGRVVDIIPNDEKKQIAIRFKVVDPVAIAKIEQGVYRGVSIGGPPPLRSGNRVFMREWGETSLVDEASNPESNELNILRAAGVAEPVTRGAEFDACVADMSGKVDDAHAFCNWAEQNKKGPFSTGRAAGPMADDEIKRCAAEYADAQGGVKRMKIKDWFARMGAVKFAEGKHEGIKRLLGGAHEALTLLALSGSDLTAVPENERVTRMAGDMGKLSTGFLDFLSGEIEAAAGGKQPALSGFTRMAQGAPTIGEMDIPEALVPAFTRLAEATEKAAATEEAKPATEPVAAPAPLVLDDKAIERMSGAMAASVAPLAEQMKGLQGHVAVLQAMMANVPGAGGPGSTVKSGFGRAADGVGLSEQQSAMAREQVGYQEKGDAQGLMRMVQAKTYNPELKQFKSVEAWEKALAGQK